MSYIVYNVVGIRFSMDCVQRTIDVRVQYMLYNKRHIMFIVRSYDVRRTSYDRILRNLPLLYIVRLWSHDQCHVVSSHRSRIHVISGQLPLVGGQHSSGGRVEVRGYKLAI